MAQKNGKRPVTRRTFLKAGLAAVGAGAAGVVAVPRRAPAQGGSAKPYAGTTLNVSCWSAPYPKWLADFLPEFTEKTGIKVNYETPAFPVYNQRMDLELSTKGSAYDVLNLTFIYTSRWIGAGWFTPLDEFLKDPNRTPPDWDPGDFLSGAIEPLKDKKGVIHGFPWIADSFMAAAGRYDLIQKAGLKMPDTFDDIMRVLKAVHDKEGVKGFITENHYGWSWIPYLQGFGGNVFRNPPDDLMPVLNSPEAIEAAEYFANLLRTYAPDGALSYMYDQALNTCLQGRTNYITFNHAWLVQLGDPQKSKVASTVAYSLAPAGPKGRFPGVAVHGFGIPAGSKKKEAAWEFIKWAMSKEMFRRMLVEKGYGSITRRSVIEAPEFKKQMTLNGYDVADLYLKTIELAAKGHMKYRTVHVYPQVDKLIDKAIELVTSRQMSAKETMEWTQTNAIAELKRAGVNL
jgi:multiple sugar transport system substrate-binding protein